MSRPRRFPTDFMQRGIIAPNFKGYHWDDACKITHILIDETERYVPYSVIEGGCLDKTDVMMAKLMELGAQPELVGRIGCNMRNMSEASVKGWEQAMKGKPPNDSHYLYPKDPIHVDSFQEGIDRLKLYLPFIKGSEISFFGRPSTKFQFPEESFNILNVGDGHQSYTLQRVQNPCIPSHLTISIMCENPKNKGKVERMVIDPAFSHTPMTLTEWRKCLGAPEDHVIMICEGDDTKLHIDPNLLCKAAKKEWDGLKASGLNDDEATAHLMSIDLPEFHPQNWTYRHCFDVLNNAPYNQEDWPFLPMVDDDADDHPNAEWENRLQEAIRKLKPLVDYEEAVLRRDWLTGKGVYAHLLSNKPEVIAFEESDHKNFSHADAQAKRKETPSEGRGK